MEVVMFIRTIILLSFAGFVSVAQTPVPTNFTFPVPVTFTAGLHNFDMVANELGMNIVYPSGSGIRYALVGVNGRLISDMEVVPNVSGNIRPSISSHVRNGIEELHIAYRSSDTIYIRRSTDGGLSWTTPQNNFRLAQTSASTNRLQMAADGDYVHVTWDTGTDEEVLYARYNLLQANWDEFMNLTDEATQIANGDTIIVYHGSLPDITISEKNGTKRVHVVFINERKIVNPRLTTDSTCTMWEGDSLLFQQTVERSAIITSGNLDWQPSDIMIFYDENPCPITGANRHGSAIATYPAIAATDSLWVVQSSKNHNWIAQSQLQWVLYHNSSAKPADYSDPPHQNGKTNWSGYYTFHHSCFYNKRDKVFQWVRRFPDGNIHVTRVNETGATTTGYTLETGSFPRGAANLVNGALILWNDSLWKGFRQTWDIEESFTLQTNVTGKSRVKQGYQLSLASSVTATVFDTLILADSSQLTLQPNSKIIIKDKGMVYVASGATLNLNNASIEMESDSAFLILPDANALRGVGSISGGRIILRNGLTVHQGDTLTFSGGTRFACDGQSVPSRINVKGRLLFTGGYTQFIFDNCIDSIFADSGRITVSESVYLVHLPDVVIWPNASLEAYGALNDSCFFQFRGLANCDVYGKIIAEFSVFEHSPIDTISYWKGLLVAYASGLVQLTSCYLRDIYIVPGGGGSALHLYQASNENNKVSKTVFQRYAAPNQPKEGDGILLQPGGSTSRLAILCCDVYPDWWVGVSAINSDVYLQLSRIHDNRIGLALTSAYSTLFENCIENHLDAGIHAYSSGISFGDPYSIPGNNRIVANDTVQVNLTYGAWAEGGSPIGYGSNNISHGDDNKRRVAFGLGSTAQIMFNWFGQPDSGNTFSFARKQAYFSYDRTLFVTHDSILTTIVHPECSFSCDELPSGPFFKAPSIPYATYPGQLYHFARNGNFHEVYRFLTSYVQNAPSARVFAAFAAHTLERIHVTRFPDSVSVSSGRLFGFLQSQYNAASNDLNKSGVMMVWANALFTMGNFSQAESKANQLRSQFSTTPYSHGALPLLQLIAMAKRDTVQMNSVISDMVQGGYSDTDIRRALAMKRGYLRVMPYSMLPKTNTGQEKSRSTIENNGQLVARAYPTPFNPSATIEYALPESVHVKLRIFDLLGREVARLVDGWQQEGTYAEVFDASHLPSGVYVYVLSSPYSHVSGRLLLMK